MQDYIIFKNFLYKSNVVYKNLLKKNYTLHNSVLKKIVLLACLYFNSKVL